jgi:transposase-like protein
MHGYILLSLKNICKICGKPMQSKGSLSLHMKTHMGPEERRKDLENGPGQESDNQWLCQECGKILSCQSKSDLEYLPGTNK